MSKKLLEEKELMCIINRISKHILKISKLYRKNTEKKRKQMCKRVQKAKVNEIMRFDYEYAYYMGKFAAYLYILMSGGIKIKKKMFLPETRKLLKNTILEK